MENIKHEKKNISHHCFHKSDIQIVVNAQGLIFRWLLPLLVKIDAATFGVNLTNYSQNITQKNVSLTSVGTTT